MTPDIDTEAREIAYTSRSSYESARLFLEQIEGLSAGPEARVIIIDQYKRDPGMLPFVVAAAMQLDAAKRDPTDQ